MTDERAPKKNDDIKKDDAKKGEVKKGEVKKDPRAPAQSLLDQERGDWEGMGQSRHQPETPPSSPPTAGKPTPGANSLAGEKQK